MEQNNRPKALEWTKVLGKAGARKPPTKRPVHLPETSRRPGKISGAASTPTQPVRSSGFVSPSTTQKATGHGRPINQPAGSPSPRRPPETSPWSFLDHMSLKEKTIVLACFLLLVLSSLHLVVGQGSEHVPSQSAASCASLRPLADLGGCDLSGQDLRGLNLVGGDLRHSDLTSTNLAEAMLDSANLTSANLTRSNLKGATLYGAMLSRATVEEINMSNVDLSLREISGIRSLNKAILRNVAFPAKVDLAGVTFVEADLSQSSLAKANLNSANFNKAKLYQTNFSGAVLKRASFEKAKMQQAYFFNAGLSGANMKDGNAHSAYFIGANTRKVDFSGSDLSYASFKDADLEDAKFSDADLSNAFFRSSTKASKADFEDTVCPDGIESDNCFFEGRLLGINP